MEIIIGLGGFAFIAGIAGFAVLLLFRGNAVLKSIRGVVQDAVFKVEVPRWGTRLSNRPPFESNVLDISQLNDLLLEELVATGLDEKLVREKISNCRVKWLRSDPSLSPRRGVKDPWGRKVKKKDEDGNFIFDEDGNHVMTDWYVAGWHEGDVVTIVYLPTDSIEDTGYAHEVCHEVCEIYGDVDYGHKRTDIWGGKGVEGAERRARDRLRAEKEEK